MDEREAYEVLGLQPGASLEDVRRAFRRLVRQTHPDKFVDNPAAREVAEEEFKRIVAARDRIVQNLSANVSGSGVSAWFSEEGRFGGSSIQELLEIRTHLEETAATLAGLFGAIEELRSMRDAGLFSAFSGLVLWVLSSHILFFPDVRAGLILSYLLRLGFALVGINIGLRGTFRALRAIFGLTKARWLWMQIDGQRVRLTNLLRNAEKDILGEELTAPARRIRPRSPSKVRAAIPFVLVALISMVGSYWGDTGGPMQVDRQSFAHMGGQVEAENTAASDSEDAYGDQVRAIIEELKQVESTHEDGLSRGDPYAITEVASAYAKASVELRELSPPPELAQYHEAMINYFKMSGWYLEEVASSGDEFYAKAYYQNAERCFDEIIRIQETGVSVPVEFRK